MAAPLLARRPLRGAALGRTLLRAVAAAPGRRGAAAGAAPGPDAEEAEGGGGGGDATGVRVYRRTRSEHHRVFRWGIGNKFRMLPANRFTPVHKPHPTESVVRDDYYESDNPNVVWEDLNECWEVYWYEHSKLNARPFPVKKFGIERAKREAFAFYEELREKGRLHEPRKLDMPQPGVFFDSRFQDWFCFFWRDGRPHARGFSAVKYGYEGAKRLAVAKQEDPVNGVLRIADLKALRQRRALLAAK